MNYTDFQIALGIKHDDRYPSILKGLVVELFTNWGIAIAKDLEQNSETIKGEYNTPISLAYKLISNFNMQGEEGTDYTIDYENGTVTILSTGSLLDNTDYLASYDYTVFLNTSNKFVKEFYPEPAKINYRLNIKPINSILSVKHDGAEWVEGTDYEFYNGRIEVLTAVNQRKPIIVEADIGYSQIPHDLKQAFYELAQIRLDTLDKKMHLIDSVSNGTSTTHYNKKPPEHILCTFSNYSPIGLVYGD